MLSVSNVSCDGESGKFKANADNIGWQGAVISRVFKHVWGTKEMAKNNNFIFNHFQMVKVVNVNIPFSPSFFVFVVPFWVNIKKRTRMEFHTTGVLCTGASGTTKAWYWGDVGNITLKLGISKDLENQ